jgi:hypothetical protein
MNPNPADNQLINKASSGDTQAFGLIIKLVAGIACKMISNAEDRKDLAQVLHWSLGWMRQGRFLGCSFRRMGAKKIL